MKPISKDVLDKICARAHYLANQMIYQANHRSNKMPGDPKVGGHSSASSSALHILGALHLLVKTGFDHIANKPHASPADHSYNYLLDVMLKENGEKLTTEEKNIAMQGLRAFPSDEMPFVFQSYHSAYDSDHHNFFPSGTVGIPPVNAGYLALAYRFARDHGYKVPEAHFWAVIGDSEFREGSLFEATPDFAEREIGSLTWIVDYNRQSLDGHRIVNKNIMHGTDADRIERTMAANGWEVIQVRHGLKRQALFKTKNGAAFQAFLEKELDDYVLQALLLVKDAGTLHNEFNKRFPQLKTFLKDVSEADLHAALRDFGGHDILAMAEALEKTKKSTRQPSIIIAHTLKGWGLDMAASQGNHSALPDEEEMGRLQENQGLSPDTLFAGFDPKSKEGQYCKTRGDEILGQMQEQYDMRDKNRAQFQKEFEAEGGIPDSMNINLKMANMPHTQWMLGQCTAKLTRIANTSDKAKENQKPLTEDERRWKTAAEMFATMAPDVGTSTNLNPAMDGKIFGAPIVEDFESQMGVRDTKTPDLVPGEEKSDRFLRFEIVEGNVMSCMGSYGRLRDTLGIPILPMMTIYDFFIKRALDQYFYNLYWKSSFILVGTPSGVTLSPEGAQHGWKSDFQIPNQITWEPAFCQELDWILSESIRRHMTNDNDGRTGVLIRGVTRGLDQKLFLANLKKQKRFKSEDAPLHVTGFVLEGAVDEATVAPVDDAQIMQTIREDVLNGAYYLVDYRGYQNYEPGDNVVNIFCMGSLVTEALQASQELLEKGIYGNVIVVTSSDLLCGNLAHANDYDYLKNQLGVSGDLHLVPAMNGHSTAGDVITLSGRRVPIVSVHDGEPGLLDNLGSIVGVKQEALAVRKHSRTGRPVDIYHYHHIDSVAVVEASEKVLADTAMETVRLHTSLIDQVQGQTPLRYGHMAAILEQKLSQQGTQLYFSSVLGSKSTIVCVHNYMGNHKSFHRHIPFLNELGYTCVTFNLFNATTIKDKSPYGPLDTLRFLSRSWKVQIEDVLDSISGPKIVFSMSGPSLSAMVVASRRKDIVKYICDGGPFSDAWACTYRMAEMMTGSHNWLVKAAWTTLGYIHWGPKSFERLQEALKQWPQQVPILSIRGLKDPVVHPKNIEDVFKNQPRLDVTVLELPEAHHLDGMKLTPDVYKSALSAFLVDGK